MVIQGETEGETFTSHVGEGFCVWTLARLSALRSGTEESPPLSALFPQGASGAQRLNS